MVKSFDVQNMEVRFRSIEQPLLNRLENARQSLIDGMNQKVKDTKSLVEQSVRILEQASPQTILNRGYSMVRTAEGKVVRSAEDVASGNRLEITPANGKIFVTVE